MKCYYFVVDLGGVELLIPNVALNGKATQSQDDRYSDPDDAQYAIDGNFSTGVLRDGTSCAISKPQSGSWWQVDLKYDFEITKVAVTAEKYCMLFYSGILESLAFLLV